MSITAPRGTSDHLPQTAAAWEAMKSTARKVFGSYGYQFMDTPIFEQTDVFVHGLGEATDVVSKEMFQVLSKDAARKIEAGEPLKADQRLALRPEGTAGIVRAVVEHNLVPQGAAPVKLMYAGPMFRCERPQKGRLREFNQIGAECLGAASPSADAELIIMLMRFYEALGIPRDSMRLLINSMGDDNCRPAFRDKIKAFILDHSDELCDECIRRAELNPLRAFDCKNGHCREVMDAAPKLADELCDECREHYESVKAMLSAAGIEYEEDPRLVRGLDYYTRTVFEVQVNDGLGSQNAIGGGGRYDKLVEISGGSSTPGLGFALGFERTLLALEAAGVTLGSVGSLDVFVAAVDADCRLQAFSLMQQLRDAGFAVDMDHQGRSLKSQLKVANKTSAALVAIIGPDELAQGKLVLRGMETHEQREIPLGEALGAVQSHFGF